MIRYFFFCSLLFCCFFGYGQAGLTATPVKFYYTLGPGGNQAQTITVSNPTNVEVEVGVSFSDWKYNELGNNQIIESETLPTSCVDWIKVLPSSYFVLQPHERKKLDIVLTVPKDADRNVPVHTALLYFSQLNPGDGGTDANGAAIKVTVRMGVKIYHSFFESSASAIEIMGFSTFKNKEKETAVYLVLENQGKIWTNGKVIWELFSKETGKKTKLDQTDFYTLPGDVRRIEKTLPGDLEKGQYVLTAIVKYKDSDAIKVAELEFTY